ncbi:MAG: ATP-binding cassette domain-containing protein, partial [Vicinamibacterales bacterium]|nr:ATP-binding cassette domain-containing protein [Vicinamibacterales bacterium]
PLSVFDNLRLGAYVRLIKRGADIQPELNAVFDLFPRLHERRDQAAGTLSGGEQQMLAIARALLGNRQLLIMDEPTEGLAPNIVSQVGDMLLALGEQEDISILLIEQNIGFATEVSEQVAIMVNGSINHVLDAAHLAADRDLQQRLLGVGRHGHEEAFEDDVAAGHEESARRDAEEGRVH